MRHITDDDLKIIKGYALTSFSERNLTGQNENIFLTRCFFEAIQRFAKSNNLDIREIDFKPIDEPDSLGNL